MNPVDNKKSSGETDMGNLIALARVDFFTFAVLLFPVLHGDKEMTVAPYVELIADRLMDSTSGPGTVLDKKAEDSITTTKGGQRYATSVGSDIAGFRANLIVIDDPMQPDEAVLESAKQKLRDWYSGVVAQRLLDQSSGVIILVMHRLAPDDLTATFVEDGGWLHISLPLIAISQERFTDRHGNILFERAPGDLLNKAWMTPETVEKLRKETRLDIFESQYQQSPQFGGSGICTIDRIRVYTEAPHFDMHVHALDVAATKGGGDWTVLLKFGLATVDELDIIFLRSIIRVRVEAPDVRELIIEQDALDKPALIIMDGNGVGLSVFQDLRRGDRHRPAMRNIESTNALYDGQTNQLKIRRFHYILPQLYNGLIQIPASMHGREVFLAELAAFPDGKHDDQVDALTIVGAYREKVFRKARWNAREYNRGVPPARPAPGPGRAPGPWMRYPK